MLPISECLKGTSSRSNINCGYFPPSQSLDNDFSTIIFPGID